MPNTILVVDDEPDLELLITQRFRKQIRERSLEFLFASNGEEALRVLDRQGSMDVVLTDINMPVMDGLTLLGKLNERFPLLKSVIVSAYGDMANIRTALNRGAFDFITKPIDFQDLSLTLDKSLQEALVRKQAAQRSRRADRAAEGARCRPAHPGIDRAAALPALSAPERCGRAREHGAGPLGRRRLLRLFLRGRSPAGLHDWRRHRERRPCGTLHGRHPHAPARHGLARPQAARVPGGRQRGPASRISTRRCS